MIIAIVIFASIIISLFIPLVFILHRSVFAVDLPDIMYSINISAMLIFDHADFVKKKIQSERCDKTLDDDIFILAEYVAIDVLLRIIEGIYLPDKTCCHSFSMI